MAPSELQEFLRSTTLLRDVDPPVLAALAVQMQPVRLAAAEPLVRQNARTQHLCLVTSGRLRVTDTTPDGDVRLISYIEPCETTCEMALLSDDPSSMTVEAVTETTVLLLARDAFDVVARAYPAAAARIVESLGRRLASYRLLIALHLNNAFDTVHPEVLRDLESELELVTLNGGDVLFRQGDRGDHLYIVVNGRVRVTVVPDNGTETSVNELGPGAVVGEMAVVSNEPRSATVVAVRDSQLARLSTGAFDRFVIRHPAWTMQLVTRQMARRLGEAIKGRAPGTRALSTVAVVPINASAPTRTFCERLQQALSRLGATAHLTSGRVDNHLGQPGIAQAHEDGNLHVRVIEWLGRQEAEHQYVVYESDPAPSGWTERCIRQADHIILLADGHGDPSLGAIETEVLGPKSSRYTARRWLVLTHDRAEPSGTARSLDARNVERHVHVRMTDRSTFDRLARLLTANAVGLTLGGGFARGLAHLGVLRAFDEFDIPVDAIGSVSMGAVVGGLWAMGRPRDRIMDDICGACANHLGDLTFPFVAIKRGARFSEAIRLLFGDVQIEDLWTPYFCISANLNRSELKVHTRGSLAKAVLASTRSPGVFPPIVFDGELHVDGGVINNTPVDIMRHFCNEGYTIGVEVAPPHQLEQVRDYGDAVNGWRVFWHRCFAKTRLYTPSILIVMIRTLEYTGIANERERRKFADLYMRPDVLKFKRTDFHRAAEIVQAGYDCARPMLTEHLATLPRIHVADAASAATSAPYEEHDVQASAALTAEAGNESGGKNAEAPV
jgi:NTE family protein